jgi:hypothetical protein
MDLNEQTFYAYQGLVLILLVLILIRGHKRRK